MDEQMEKERNLIMKKLVPKEEGQKINYEIFQEYFPSEPIELWGGIPILPAGSEEIDKLILCLIYSVGLEQLANILPERSKEELLYILANPNARRIPVLEEFHKEISEKANKKIAKSLLQEGFADEQILNAVDITEDILLKIKENKNSQ